MKHTLEVTAKCEELTNLLKLIESEIQEVEAKQKVLDDFDFKLREKEKEIESAWDKVSGAQEEVKMERDYVIRHKEELNDREFKLTQQERKIQEAQTIFKELEKERNLVNLEKEKLSEMMKDVESFKKEKENIDHLRGMLERDAVVDRERKKMLNEQEAHNIAEKERLQKLAEQFDK